MNEQILNKFFLKTRNTIHGRIYGYLYLPKYVTNSSNDAKEPDVQRHHIAIILNLIRYKPDVTTAP